MVVKVYQGGIPELDDVRMTAVIDEVLQRGLVGVAERADARIVST